MALIIFIFTLCCTQLLAHSSCSRFMHLHRIPEDEWILSTYWKWNHSRRLPTPAHIAVSIRASQHMTGIPWRLRIKDKSHHINAELRNLLLHYQVHAFHKPLLTFSLLFQLLNKLLKRHARVSLFHELFAHQETSEAAFFSQPENRLRVGDATLAHPAHILRKFLCQPEAVLHISKEGSEISGC